MLKIIMRDLKYESTIPFVQKFEEKYIKTNEKIRDRYFNWKWQMRNKIQWKNEKQSFVLFEQYIFKHVRTLPKLNKKIIFDLIRINKRLQIDLHTLIDKFYAIRLQKMQLYKKQLDSVALKNLYDIQKTEIQYYKTVIKLKQLSDDTIIPFQTNLKNLYEKKKSIYYKDLYLGEPMLFLKGQYSLYNYVADYWEDFKDAYYQRKLNKAMTGEQVEALSTPINAVGSSIQVITHIDVLKTNSRRLQQKLELRLFLKITCLTKILLQI